MFINVRSLNYECQKIMIVKASSDTVPQYLNILKNLNKSNVQVHKTAKFQDKEGTKVCSKIFLPHIFHNYSIFKYLFIQTMSIEFPEKIPRFSI